MKINHVNGRRVIPDKGCRDAYLESLRVEITPKQMRYLKEQALIKNVTVTDVVRELIERARFER